jgi:serine/threonine-protein kinase RsbW
MEEVLERIASLGWEGRDYFGVQMTLEESLTNAIRHGNLCDESKLVRAECKVGSNRFWLSVEDEGEGFQPDAVPDCRDDENLESFGGRGMLLIRSYMSEVRFNDRGNCITVETHRGFHPPDQDDSSDE